MKRVVIGVGNPIMGDDGVGVHVANILRERLSGSRDVDVKDVCLGGFGLADEMLGYDEAIIIDAIATKSGRIGEIYKLTPDQLRDTVYMAAPHSVNFATALEMHEKLVPERMPHRIMIYAVEVKPVFRFSEQLSPETRKAAIEAAEKILKELD